MLEIVCEKNAKTRTNSEELKFTELSRKENILLNPKIENEVFS